jgi:hypothetical protein
MDGARLVSDLRRPLGRRHAERLTEITVTEAVRHFADLLDEVEHDNKSFVVVRRGRPVAKAEPTQPLLRDLLGQLEDMGYLLTPPGGQYRHDYINVTPVGQRSRVLSIHGSTGRAEFQVDSWDRVGHLKGRFVRLAAGNKAAHPLQSRASTTCDRSSLPPGSS